MRKNLAFLISCVALHAAAAQPSAMDAAAGATTNRAPAEHQSPTKYLFIDRAYVQRLEGVDEVFHQPVKERGPVVGPDRAWEQARLHIWNAPVWSKERSRWQMWYYGGEDLLLLYAESPDGLRWDKPRLGLVDWKGSKENNIINLGFKTRSPKENRIVLMRDDLETDSARRFKGLVRAGAQLVALVSADGLNWKRLESNPIPSDDEYRLSYDALNHRFLATVKRSGQGSGHAAGNRPLSQFGRRVALSTSRDFVRWREPELILWGDQEDQQLGRKRIQEAIEDADRRAPTVVRPNDFYTDIYNMPLFTYEDLYLGLPVIFNQSGRYSHSTGASQDGILYASLVASRDLRHWDRLNRQPFIPHSRLSDPQNYDHGMIQATQPVRRGDALWFYYTGTRFTHLKRELIEQAGLRKSPDEPLGAIFLARLRLDGFASLSAGPQPGSVLTVPVKVAARKLCVNADAKAGELRVEIRDAKDGTAIPGYALEAVVPVCENATRVPIRWQQKSDVSELAGREVRLYFSLRNAHLYSFWFDD